MVALGKFNRLMVLERSEGMVILAGGSQGNVFLPRKEAPLNIQAGEILNVFVYLDASSETLLATTREPRAVVGQFAYLKVASLQPVGAFLDWGLAKELFLPFREQTRDLKVGDYVAVYLYLDSSSRISASMRVEKYIDKNLNSLRDGDKVNLFLFSTTDIGIKAIVNQRYMGVIYRNEIFQAVQIGQSVEGFIKKIREDGMIDLSLQQSGFKACGEVSQKILTLLKQSGGFLPVTDKSSSEKINELFGVSKKKYKMAVGSLYKKQEVMIEEDGIRLVPKVVKPKVWKYI